MKSVINDDLKYLVEAYDSTFEEQDVAPVDPTAVVDPAAAVDPAAEADPTAAGDEETVATIADIIEQSKQDPNANAQDLLSLIAQALNPEAGEAIGAAAQMAAPLPEEPVEPVTQAGPPLEEDGDPEEEEDDSWAGYDKENEEGDPDSKPWEEIDEDKDPRAALGGPTGHLAANVNPPSFG